MSSPRPVRRKSPWLEAGQAFDELSRAVEKAMARARDSCAAGVLVTSAGAQIDGLSAQAAVLVAAAYESFHAPRSGARMTVLRSDLGGDLGWRVGVHVAWEAP